jgi:hypothetical protein
MRATLAGLLLCTSVAAPACDRPDGMIELSGGSVAVGVGYTWAKGVLRYQGRSIPVTLKGLSVASVGGSSIRATGDVCNLASLEDFDGNYTAVSAGATLAGGAAAAAMENQKGVVIMMHSTNQGVQFNLSVEGVAMRIAER